MADPNCTHCGGKGFLWTQSLLTAEQDEQKPCFKCGTDEAPKAKETPMSDATPQPKLRPLGNRVLVSPREAASTTKGGIVIPDVAKEQPREGEVLAVSDDCDPIIKPGMVVIYPKFAGNDFRVQDQDLKILDADDLLAYVTP